MFTLGHLSYSVNEMVYMQRDVTSNVGFRPVAATYGWTDLDLGHGFHETKQGVRYTINEPARREVLARLLKLNHERHAEEVKQGLHEKRKGRAKKKAKPDEGGVLFE